MATSRHVGRVWFEQGVEPIPTSKDRDSPISILKAHSVLNTCWANVSLSH